MEHLQVSNVSDISALLPGGKTKVPDLTANHIFSLRDGGSTAGNAAFGTAVEVDGVRIGNNGSFGNMNGVDTRNITVADIESVEVITGVPSAEYGDLNSGMVKIHTRKGKTPWNILLSINPRTEQVSFAKGLDLGNDKGVININGEWTKATQKLVSPYSSYTRRGFSAGYSNTFRNVLRFDIGVTGNIGGMNTKDDPDAYSGEYNKVRDNVFRANTSLAWLLNKSWITNLKFDASIYYNDNNSHAHTFYSYASEQPAVHATEEGYFMANKLPYTYFADQIIESKELDYAASLKYEWNRRFKTVNSNLKAGVQWKATGNVGEGEYYKDPALAPNGYRPRPYTAYPYMHNVSLYAEESLSFPVGNTMLRLMAGVRWEHLFIKGTKYKNLNTLSPRFNARWQLNEYIAIRGGWGITEKLPSFYTLYPKQEYRDIQGLLDKIRSTGMGGISADDPQAVQKLEKKLESLEKSQETMKAVNAYYRKHKTLDGCPHLPPEELEKLKADMASSWHLEDKPFATWALSNNSAEIRRVKDRIKSLSQQKEIGFVGWEFDGGKVEANTEANRLQIFFEDKPDEATREALKSNGFRWSPKAGAWQRQLTSNAYYAADYVKAIAPLTGEKPTELQRAHIRAQKVAAQEQPTQEQPEQEAPQDKDTFSIYQIKGGDETRDLRFEPYDRLTATGHRVDAKNYTLVYSAELTPGTSLEDIYTRFNIDHPKDFKGHSLSVSDVVVLHQNGQDTAHYVDSFGYKDVPEFLQPENYLKTAEQTTEQNYNMIDGQINNTPTVAELEAKVKTGETISLVDLAETVKADKERGKAAKTEKKPSIRAQLKAAKEQTPKKQAKQKTQDLERS